MARKHIMKCKHTVVLYPFLKSHENFRSLFFVLLLLYCTGTYAARYAYFFTVPLSARVILLFAYQIDIRNSIKIQFRDYYVGTPRIKAVLELPGTKKMFSISPRHHCSIEVLYVMFLFPFFQSDIFGSLNDSGLLCRASEAALVSSDCKNTSTILLSH